jgi:cell division protein FtsW
MTRIPLSPLNPARIQVSARAVREAAGGGISAGARSVREVAEALREPSWTEDQKRIALPVEMRQERLDYVVFFTALGLFVLGLAMVFSAGAFAAQFHSSGPYARLLNQGIRGLVGIVLLVVVARIDYRRWDAWSPWIVIGTALSLILVLLPGLGHVKGGAQRWIGFGPVVIQPTEFARVALIVYLARVLSKRPEQMGQFQSGPLPAFIAAGVFMFLILLQPNLGSAAAIGLTVLMMCVVAGMRWKHFGMIFGVAVLAALLAVTARMLWGGGGLHEYQGNRITDWINMWMGRDNPQDETYQLRQSMMSIGSGGLFGKGIGAGQQKWYFLPDAHTDFIYSLIGEELGFIGCFGVLLAFAVLIWRGLDIALEAEDRYGYLLAAGITINFAVYVTINLAVTMGLLPTTGLPLPLISYGGSALMANMVAVGLLLSVSRRRGSGIVLSGRMRRRSFL